MDWTKLLKVADIAVDVGQKIAKVVRRRRQPPAPMADLDETADVIERGHQEWLRKRRE